MIDRRTLALALALASGCSREQPPSENEPPPQKAPRVEEAAENPPPRRGPVLLWIFPRLSATLRGEQAEPLSQPVSLELDDGSVSRLGVRIREGDLVQLPDDGGRAQTIYLELLELSDDEESRTLHRFTLPLVEGPDAEPTDDMIRAWVEEGDRVVVALSRRGLRENVDELEDEPEVVESVTLARTGEGRLEAVRPADARGCP